MYILQKYYAVTTTTVVQYFSLYTLYRDFGFIIMLTITTLINSLFNHFEGYTEDCRNYIELKNDLRQSCVQHDIWYCHGLSEYLSNVSNISGLRKEAASIE
jgi:hypothetical protein